MVKFVEPTMEMVETIARDMRQADKDEVWASNHHGPYESLIKGWAVSDYASVALSDDGEPLAMLGLVKRDLLTGSGVVWLLGTNESMKYKKEFLKQTKQVIDDMLTICPRLCNMVHNKNKSSITWLKWLGFKLDDPEPYGPENELFHRFYLERSV